jgi:hypothetical protein
MSKANLNNSFIGIFMKTYCLSGDPVFDCFITDSNDQLTAETLAFSSYKTNQNNL